MKSGRCLFLILSVFMLAACGQMPVEGDKHPDIPLFPEHTGTYISIKPFARLSERLFTNGNYIYGHGTDTYTHKGKGFLIYDKQFHLLSVLKEGKAGKVLLYMDRRNGVYSYQIRGQYVLNTYRVQVPSFHKKRLSIVDLDEVVYQKISNAEKKKYAQQIAAEADKEGFDENTYIRQLRVNALVLKMSKNLQCITQMHHENYIFEYPDRSVIVKLYHAQYKFKKFYCHNQQPVDPKIPVASLGKTVLYNRDVGYYGLGFETAFGYDYLSLKVGNGLGMSKIKNRNKKPGLYLMYQDPHKMIVAPAEDMFSLYIVTEKK